MSEVRPAADLGLRVYSPTPILGYGYHLQSLKTALDGGVDLIAVDGGSSDPGPNYLADGTCFTNPMLVKRDLGPLLAAAHERGIPIAIGTAGGSGGEPHLELTERLVTEVAQELGIKLRVALIHSEQPRERVNRFLVEGRIEPLWPLPSLRPETVANSSRIVALMGAEPFATAFAQGAQIVIAGRSDDAAVTAGYAISHGIPPAEAWLAGKFLECGSACLLPRHGYGFDGVLATLEPGAVTLEPLHPGLRCTTQSAAAFLLHETESPIEHPEPGGCLDLSALEIEELDAARVRLTGACFKPAPMTVRLEGVELAGHRTITLAWTRDPILIPQIDSYLATARERAEQRLRTVVPDGYELNFRVVGKDAVMGSREPERDVAGHELGIVIDAVADTPEHSGAVCAAARTIIKNSHFPGKLCDEGCVTFPYSPSDIKVGPVYRYSIWHLVRDPDLGEMFPIEHCEVGP